MKKLLSVLLAMSLGFAVVGCGSTASNNNSSSEATTETGANNTTSGEKIIIGLDDKFHQWALEMKTMKL